MKVSSRLANIDHLSEVSLKRLTQGQDKGCVVSTRRPGASAQSVKFTDFKLQRGRVIFTECIE